MARNCRGGAALRYGVALDADDPYALAEEAFCDLPVVASLGGGTFALETSLLSISGAELSALRRVGGGVLEMRVFNPSAQARLVQVRAGTGPLPDPDARQVPVRGQLVDLRGRHLASFEGSFELGPHRIATARLAVR